MPHIADAQFRERFSALYFGGHDLPKKPLDRQIVLISALIDEATAARELKKQQYLKQ